MNKIEIIKESILSIQICTTIIPEDKGSINTELVTSGLNISGTTNGWVLDESVAPVKCSEYSDRWHYICVC